MDFSGNITDDLKYLDFKNGFIKLGLSEHETEILVNIVKYIISIDWSKQEERLERIIDLSLLIDKFKKSEI